MRMIAMALVVLCAMTALAVMVPQPAAAACDCQCVDGEMRAICSSSIDIAPICPPRVCPIAPPRVTPLPSVRVPPVGTTSCRKVQVLNENTRRYEWQDVCD